MGTERIIWEVSILKISSSENTIYKVTRQIVLLSISETKLFSNFEEALAQLKMWSE